MANKRSFTLISSVLPSGGMSDDNGRGRYLSTTPMGAAKKAGRQIMKDYRKNNASVVVYIKETTKNMPAKIFKYSVSRIYDPVTIVRNGVQVTYKYRTVAKSI